MEEYKDALNARRGPWGVAPTCDELWDGERRVFWERELTTDELKEIQRFRRLARYAMVLQNTVGGGFIRIPMPKIPAVIHELVKLGNEEKSRKVTEDVSPKSSDTHRANHIAFPEDDEEDQRPTSVHSVAAEVGFNCLIHDANKSQSFNPQQEEEFSYDNPARNKSSSPSLSAEVKPSTLSESQRASIRAASKVAKVDVIHRGRSRSKQKRMRKRRETHAILQPWFALFYFFLPILLLSTTYIVPFAFELFLAWKHEKAIQAAIELPAIIQAFLPIGHPWLQSTVQVGYVAFEMTGILYFALMLVTQLIIFVIVRPMVLSLSHEYANRS